MTIDIKRNKLENLISANPDIVEFGNAEDAVEELWIIKAEKALGLKLTDSYKWFLKNYCGGEVCGEEVFTIYGIDFEEVNGGDIVYQHIINKRNNLTTDSELVLSETDLGEVFYFDYSEFDGKECPIRMRLPSGKSEKYGDDFYDYLHKRIEAYF